MIQADRIGDYLRRLTPQARSSLLIELERLEACGAQVPGTAPLLENLRAEFRKSEKTHHRVANPSRHFFNPVEPLLVDGAPEHENSGRILRGSLAAIWELINRDLLPTMTAQYVDQMRPLIASDNQPEIRKVAAAFQTKVVSYLDNVLGSPDGAARARTNLATYTASRTTYGDLTKVLSVLRARDALAKFNEALPPSIQNFDDARVLKITRLLHAFRITHPEEIPFALALVAKRLKTPWHLIRLATKAAPSKNAADVAATPYAIVVSMVLDRLEDKRAALRLALKNNRVLVAKEILTEIYDTEYALQVRIDRLDQSNWGSRLKRLMNSIAALVEAEVARFPDDVGHVLGSRRLRRHRSLAGRLTYLAYKGRDVLSNGAARCRKLIGKLPPPDQLSNRQIK
jgi:hypothetical protein